MCIRDSGVGSAAMTPLKNKVLKEVYGYTDDEIEQSGAQIATDFAVGATAGLAFPVAGRAVAAARDALIGGKLSHGMRRLFGMDKDIQMGDDTVAALQENLRSGQETLAAQGVDRPSRSVEVQSAGLGASRAAASGDAAALSEADRAVAREAGAFTARAQRKYNEIGAKYEELEKARDVTSENMAGETLRATGARAAGRRLPDAGERDQLAQDIADAARRDPEFAAIQNEYDTIKTEVDRAMEDWAQVAHANEQQILLGPSAPAFIEPTDVARQWQTNGVQNSTVEGFTRLKAEEEALWKAFDDETGLVRGRGQSDYLVEITPQAPVIGLITELRNQAQMLTQVSGGAARDMGNIPQDLLSLQDGLATDGSNLVDLHALMGAASYYRRALRANPQSYNAADVNRFIQSVDETLADAQWFHTSNPSQPIDAGARDGLMGHLQNARDRTLLRHTVQENAALRAITKTQPTDGEYVMMPREAMNSVLSKGANIREALQVTNNDPDVRSAIVSGFLQRFREAAVDPTGQPGRGSFQNFISQNQDQIAALWGDDGLARFRTIDDLIIAEQQAKEGADAAKKAFKRVYGDLFDGDLANGVSSNIIERTLAPNGTSMGATRHLMSRLDLIDDGGQFVQRFRAETAQHVLDNMLTEEGAFLKPTSIASFFKTRKAKLVEILGENHVENMEQLAIKMATDQARFARLSGVTGNQVPSTIRGTRAVLGPLNWMQRIFTFGGDYWRERSSANFFEAYSDPEKIVMLRRAVEAPRTRAALSIATSLGLTEATDQTPGQQQQVAQ